MDVKNLLKELHLFAKSSLSQSFLNSENISEKIVRHAALSKEDVVLEIGMGLGILTTFLQKKVSQVITVEKDKRLALAIPSLQKFDPKTEVIVSDFLKYDLKELKERFKTIKVVANLPFHISTEILFRLFEHHDWIQSMTLMFQREVGKRIVAQPGNKDYGILSLLTQLYSKPKILFEVKSHSFYPVPKVSASVIFFEMRKELPLPKKEAAFFIQVVKMAFGQRRKTLYNNLRRFFPSDFKTMIDLKRRAETLSFEEFKELTRSLK